MSSTPPTRLPTDKPPVLARAPSPVPPPPRAPTCVYGDSTPFPHEGNFVETIRHAVDCGVTLLGSQHLIHKANARAHEVDRWRSLERMRIESMSASLQRALAAEMGAGSDRLLRAGARILETSRAVLESELATLDVEASQQLAQARRSAEQSRAVAKRALESFLVLHDLPGSETALRLEASEDRYAAEAHTLTTFGVDATFELQIPDAHEWGRHSRVGDSAPGTGIHLSLESGLFFKKLAVQPVKLDRLFVSSVRIGTARGTVILRKQPTSGAGYKLDFDASGDRRRVLLSRLGEDGMETAEPVIELSGDDTVHVLRMYQRIVDSTEDLARRRQSMTRATFEGMPLGDLDEPRLVAERLIGVLAPIVREIARRSGAPGELVLRRDVRAGRREEVYITTAELHERVLTLPPLLRGTFGPFELDKPRSPRAPAPSLPAYTELDDSDLVEVATTRTAVAEA